MAGPVRPLHHHEPGNHAGAPAGATRSHWKIKSSLHRVLAVVKNEDRTRNWTLDVPECLAILRRIALNIVRLLDDRSSPKGGMQIAAMSDEYLLGVLMNAVGKFQRRKPA